MPNVSKLGQRIKSFRLEHDMTQGEAATFLGVSKPTIFRLENGIGRVMDLTKAKIERKLDKTEVTNAA